MKNQKGISRISIVIIIAIIVVVVALIAGIIVGNNSKKRQQKEAQEYINAQIAEQEKQNAQSNNEIAQEQEEKVDPFEFTKEFLKQGKSYGQVEIIDNRLDNVTVLSITGVAENDINQANYVSTKNRWYTTIDLTKYKTLEVYARRGKDNGDMMICIDNTIIKRVRFTELPTTWTKYEIDISEYEGKHVVALAGGYADNSGIEASNTQYCNIRLK